ncbi:MAG: hypothetical protein OXU20_27300 [Myxococcales bacterium]|nr:hypothetical protein [Myxococcales bacterium]
MRVFQRLRHTVSVGIDSLLDQVENQQAVATASIREVEQGLGRIRVHRKRCERRVAELEQAVEKLSVDAQQWRERTLRFREDRPRALQCMRRLRAAESERARRQTELESQRVLAERITRDERAVEVRLSELRGRCAELSTREARSQAMATAEPGIDLDGVFDRWEARLEGADDGLCKSASPDVFADDLARDEEAEDLQAQLDRMLSEAQGHHGGNRGDI